MVDLSPQLRESDETVAQRRWLPKPTKFFGRQADLDWLNQALNNVSCVGILVTGSAGSGKSDLVTVAAWDQCRRYQQAVWVDLREVLKRTTEELLRHVLNRLFLNATDDDPLIELARQLTVSPTLIVLDHLDELSDYEQVALNRFIALLPRSRSHVVMTSAKTLRVVEDSQHVVTRSLDGGLDLPASRELIAEHAARLSCDALKSTSSTTDSQSVHKEVERLAKRLHGHPQLLIWAVGLATRGVRRLQMLTAVLPDEPAEQPREMTSLLIKWLDPEAQRVMPLLSFFPTGRIAPEALKAVCLSAVEADQQQAGGAASPASLDLGWVVRGPQQLLKCGLMQHDTSRDLYLCPQLLLSESIRLGLANHVRGITTLRLLMHYAEAVQSNKEQFQQLDRIAASTQLLMEGFWSQRTKASPVDRILTSLTDGLNDYWLARGHRRLNSTWAERIEKITGIRRTVAQPETPRTTTDQTAAPTTGATNQNPQAVLTRFDRVLGEWLSLSDADRARRWAQLALQNADAVETALLWLAHSVTCFQSGDVSGCDAALKQADQLAASVGRNDVRELAASLAEQRVGAQASAGAVQEHLTPALKHLEKGNAVDALPLLEKALTAARTTQQPLAIATCLLYLGRSQSLLDHRPQAVSSLREALGLAKQSQDQELICEIEQFLGKIEPRA